MHGSFVLAVVEVQGGSGLDSRGVALGEIGIYLSREAVVGGPELGRVETDLLGVAHHGLATVERGLLEQHVMHVLELAELVRGEGGLCGALGVGVLLERKHHVIDDDLALERLHDGLEHRLEHRAVSALVVEELGELDRSVVVAVARSLGHVELHGLAGGDVLLVEVLANLGLAQLLVNEGCDVASGERRALAVGVRCVRCTKAVGLAARRRQ